jgi:hypothetical protein
VKISDIYAYYQNQIVVFQKTSHLKSNFFVTPDFSELFAEEKDLVALDAMNMMVKMFGEEIINKTMCS